MGRMKAIFMTLMMLALVCAPAGLQAEEPLPVVKGIRVFVSGDNLGVEITADKSFEYTCTKMPHLLRVVVDLPLSEPGRPDTVYKYKSALISTIELEKKEINNVTITRFSINLTEDADFTVQKDASDKTKLTLMFRRLAPGSTAGTTAAKPPVLGAKVEPAAEKPTALAAPVPKPVSTPVSTPFATPIATPVSTPVSTPVGTRVSKLAVSGINQPVTITAVDCGADAIEIRSNGKIGDFDTFTLEQPGRLVIDISGAQSALRSIVMPANRLGVIKARVALFEGKLRVVLDVGAKPFPRYDVVKTATGLRIVSLAAKERK
jgi:hypothetical protein